MLWECAGCCKKITRCRELVDGNLEGILLDLENMRKKILSQEKEFSNCDIYDVWNQQRRQGKKELLDVIKAGVRNYVLYYSGHGEEDSGNWVIGKADMDEVEIVTFEEILLL